MNLETVRISVATQNTKALTGRVEWMGVSAHSRSPIEVVESAMVETGKGIVGDYHGGDSSADRQITLIQFEHLPILAAFLGRSTIDPALLRRNVVVSGINLLQFLNTRFRAGETLLEGVEPCDPCRRMEENLGKGAIRAMLGHGGIVARVLDGGRLSVGDSVQRA